MRFASSGCAGRLYNSVNFRSTISVIHLRSQRALHQGCSPVMLTRCELPKKSSAERVEEGRDTTADHLSNGAVHNSAGSAAQPETAEPADAECACALHPWGT